MFRSIPLVCSLCAMCAAQAGVMSESQVQSLMPKVKAGCMQSGLATSGLHPDEQAEACTCAAHHVGAKMRTTEFHNTWFPSDADRKLSAEIEEQGTLECVLPYLRNYLAREAMPLCMASQHSLPPLQGLGKEDLHLVCACASFKVSRDIDVVALGHMNETQADAATGALWGSAVSSCSRKLAGQLVHP